MKLKIAGIGCLLLCAVACTSEPQAAMPGGIPASWYAAVDDAIAGTPDVGAAAIEASGGPCPLRNTIDVDGHQVSKVLGHGVLRIDGKVPAVICEWYEGIPVDVTVARADDDSGYRTLVDNAAAIRQSGNVQTQQNVAIGGRTVTVVRTRYPTNLSAGTDFEAFYLDRATRGMVSLRVSNSDQRSAAYDETAAATDLVRFLDG